MKLKFSSILSEVRDEFSPYSADVLYLGGCPLRCPYCFVPDLLDTKTCEEKDVEELAAYFLKKNTRALSVKGGEPFTQGNALLQLLRMLKGHGVKTKTETAGYFPESLRAALEWLDHAAVDVKTRLEPKAYHEMTGVKGDLALMNLLKTLAFLESTPFPVFREIRFTVVPGKNDDPKTVQDVASYVRNYCDLFVLQQFDPKPRLVDERYRAMAATPIQSLTDLAMLARNLVPNVAIKTANGVQYLK
ncbi:4Fe-4S cluster-binding domain-containing protein [Candidatus Micrarchaeota archaeon]|nr:4Fe-4S cluster-binding domain-containing protein [Candidatus Micrarchaeota archaeon]